MAEGSERGVAYDFWVRVRNALADKGWTDTELHRRTGVARSTVNNLKTATRVSRSTVNTLAKALDIDPDEARRLAGIAPEGTSRGGSVREAIRRDPNYDDYQREQMLAFIDLIEQNARPPADREGDEEPDRRKAG